MAMVPEPLETVNEMLDPPEAQPDLIGPAGLGAVDHGATDLDTAGQMATEVDPDVVNAAVSALAWGDATLLPAIIQDITTGDVLMLAWMDQEAVRRTLSTGRVTFWSRSRQEYWRKGDTSGHRQYVRHVSVDCDADTLLVKVVQIGAACHTGTKTCFDERELPAARIAVG